MARQPLLIRNVGLLATARGTAPRRGAEMDRIETREKVAILVEEGRFAGIYPEGGIPRRAAGEAERLELDAEGRLATPGLVDPHTHLVFAGSRSAEYERLLRGASYFEIAEGEKGGGGGGGIRATVAAVRAASSEALRAAASARLSRMLSRGTCVVEVKSGYGLDLETEIRMLEVVASLRRQTPQEIAATFLGAHAVAPEFAGRREAYVEEVIERMLPEVARRKLAESCDVFCEPGAFTVDESRRILEAARQAGLSARLHAEQFSRREGGAGGMGGAALAAEIGALSADHLAAVDDADIQALARAGVVATVLPGAALQAGPFERRGGWGWGYARRLTAGGCPLAIGTDCNPGSSYLESMPLAMALACALYRLTPAEALTAATLNAACALGRGQTCGSVEPGKRADLVLWDAETPAEIPYRFGLDLVRGVICGGEPASGFPEALSSMPCLPADGRKGRLNVWIDGAARGNPGPAAAGVVIEDASGRVLLDQGYTLGERTNNVAEYSALLAALAEAERMGAVSLRIHSDSELLVRQLSGRYRVRHANLVPLASEARRLLARFREVEIVHVCREENRRADAAANRVLDAQDSEA